MTTPAPHRIAPVWCLLVLALFIAACGSSSQGSGQSGGGSLSPATPTCDPVYKALNFTSSQQQQAEASGRCVTQDLNLSGEVTSHITIGVRLIGILSCSPTPNQVLVGTDFNFVQGPQVYKLSIQPAATATGKDQDVPFDPNYVHQVWLTDAASVGNSIWTQKSGTIHVNADSTAGTVDAVIARDQPGAGEVHVSGSWRCGI
jgi:hypothetical protein